jgi:dynein heavy chain
VALQEAGRMNSLLVEMKRSMDELLLGLDGALNMSEKMEALARGIATNSVPALWMAQMSTRVQEVGCCGGGGGIMRRGARESGGGE